MSSIHVAKQGYITKETLPVVSRDRGEGDDPYSQNNVLLLNGNGTDGAQNNTFIGETFQPDDYAVSFDGTGDYLKTASSAGTSGNFTLEAWVYRTAATTGVVLTCGSESSNRAYMYVTSANQLGWGVYFVNDYTLGGTVPLNVWTHIAIVRTGSTVKGYINGVALGTTTTYSGTIGNTGGYAVGANVAGTSPFSGYVSNARIVYGSAVYTSDFTPPTGSLEAVSGTALLTCQDATIVDNSSNNFTITANGNAAAFATSTLYLTVTRNGNATQGSFSPFSIEDGKWGAYFDGSGDYLSVASNAAFSVGSGNFTMEAWIYPTSSSGVIISTGTGSGQIGIELSSGKLIFVIQFVGLLTGSTTIAQNKWTHVAATRNGTTVTLWVNGVSDGTSTRSNSLGEAGCGIGLHPSGTGTGFAGYISNARFVVGTAVYTSAFTPPTSPLTAVSGTSLLTCQSNRFVDNSSNAFAITRNGDVRVTAFSPFAPTAAYDASTNGGSGYWDGSGDQLQVPSSSELEPGSGDFTIEAWIYPLAYPGSGTGAGIASRANASGYANFSVTLRNNGAIEAYFSLSNTSSLPNIITAGTCPIGAWSHVAFVKSGLTRSLYVNGVRVGTTTSASNPPTGLSTITRVGYADATLNGYLSDVRIVKGTAVYSGTSFTPPTAPLTAITNTSLLLNFTNAGIFDSTGKNVLETVGNAQIDTTVKKYGTGSMEFDGAGDLLYLASRPEIDLGGGDFTIEFWINAPSRASYQGIVTKRNSVGTGAGTWGVRISSANAIEFRDLSSGTLVLSFGNISANTWTHVAISRSGSSCRGFVNGSLLATATNSTNFTNVYPMFIGLWGTVSVAYPSGTFDGQFNGYIDDFRITKGVARYTADFTPPTGELSLSTSNIVTNNVYGVYQLS